MTWVDPSPSMTPSGGLPFTMSPWARRLYDRTRVLSQNPDTEGDSFPHAILCEALSTSLRQAGDIADPTDPHPPLAPLLDPDLCPAWALPWLAMAVGVDLPEGTEEATARTLIRDVRGWRRGSPASVRAAVESTLTGTRTVFFRERDGGPWNLGVVTLTAETPNPAATLAAAMAAKPAGIVVTHTVVNTWDYAQLKADAATRTENYADTKTHYTDYMALTGRQRT